MRKFLNSVALAGCIWLGASAYAAAQTDFNWTGQLSPGQSIEIIGVNGSIHASAARDGNIAVSALKTAGTEATRQKYASKPSRIRAV